MLLFENNARRTSHKRCFFLIIKIKDYNAIINGRNFCNKQIINGIKTYENIWKDATGKEDDYTTGYLLDYPS